MRLTDGAARKGAACAALLRKGQKPLSVLKTNILPSSRTRSQNPEPMHGFAALGAND